MTENTDKKRGRTLADHLKGFDPDHVHDPESVHDHDHDHDHSDLQDGAEPDAPGGRPSRGVRTSAADSGGYLIPLDVVQSRRARREIAASPTPRDDKKAVIARNTVTKQSRCRQRNRARTSASAGFP